MAFQFSQTGQELQYLANEVTQLAGDYDSSVTYAVGDYCNHEGVVYRCTASTTGTFDAADWSTVIVLDELKALKARVTTAEGNISTAQGNITTLNTTVGNIGTFDGGTAQSATLASGSFATICTMTIADAGIYVATGDLMFDTNTSGNRIVILDTTATSTNDVNNSVVAMGRATLCKTRIMSLAANTTLYLRAYQNSGSSMSVGGRIRAVRIK